MLCAALVLALALSAQAATCTCKDGYSQSVFDCGLIGWRLVMTSEFFYKKNSGVLLLI